MTLYSLVFLILFIILVFLTAISGICNIVDYNDTREKKRLGFGIMMLSCTLLNIIQAIGIICKAM